VPFSFHTSRPLAFTSLEDTLQSPFFFEGHSLQFPFALDLPLLLRGHYAYFGIAGNFRALQKVYRAVERYWHKMVCSRSWKGRIGWTVFNQIKAQSPLLRPKLYLPYRELQASAML
jgi:hypothetical protein